MIKRFIVFVFTFVFLFSYTCFAKERDVVKVPALMYHSVTVGDTNAIISPENFRKHLEAMKNDGFTPVSLEEVVDFVDNGGVLPKKPVLITFDDGYTNNFTEAFPILSEYNFKATIFAIVNSVGLDTYKGTLQKMNSHFDYSQGKIMIDSGLISIQSHTYDMHQWPAFESTLNARETVLRMPGESLLEYVKNFEKDFLKSKNLIESELKNEVIGFSYPLGKYDAVSDFILKKNGIRATFSTSTGQNYIRKYDKNSLYNLNRHNMYDKISVDQLLYWLNED